MASNTANSRASIITIVSLAITTISSVKPTTLSFPSQTAKAKAHLLQQRPHSPTSPAHVTVKYSYLDHLYTVLPQPIISRDFYFCNDVISWCTLALQRSSRRCVSQPCVGGYQSGGGDIRVVKVVEKELVTTLLKFCCPPLPKLMGEPACSLAVKDDLK